MTRIVPTIFGCMKYCNAREVLQWPKAHAPQKAFTNE